jgi:hypothetical protein
MTPEQRCASVAPRAVPCADELLITLVDSALADDPEVANKVDNSLRASPRATGDQARVMHNTNCVSGSDYTDAVLACWNAAGCKSFAACVKARRKHGA